MNILPNLIRANAEDIQPGTLLLAALERSGPMYWCLRVSNENADSDISVVALNPGEGSPKLDVMIGTVLQFTAPWSIEPVWQDICAAEKPISNADAAGGLIFRNEGVFLRVLPFSGDATPLVNLQTFAVSWPRGLARGTYPTIRHWEIISTPNPKLPPTRLLAF